MAEALFEPLEADVAPKWTAEMVKAALRRRHPATQSMGVRQVPGPWTCIEELLGCDLVAFAAVRSPKNGPPGARYPRVGYEVKVSRSDYRKELRSPSKRVRAVALTHAFYFAVPIGLLREDERERRQPWPDGAALWVPEDVGLVEVHRGGCRVVHQAPTRKEPEVVDGRLLGACARHISSHPDPRHDGLVESDRELSAAIRSHHAAANRQQREVIKAWTDDLNQKRKDED